MKHTKTLSYIGLLIALSLVLQRLSFPIIPLAPYLKLEFSSIPIIVVAIRFGIKHAVFSAIVVNLIDFLMMGSITGVPLDQAINVIAIIVFIVILKYFVQKKQYITALMIAIFCNVIVLTALNYFILTPFYFHLANLSLPEQFLWWCIKVYGVFNFIKWSSVGVAYLIINNTYLKNILK